MTTDHAPGPNLDAGADSPTEHPRTPADQLDAAGAPMDAAELLDAADQEYAQADRFWKIARERAAAAHVTAATSAIELAHNAERRAERLELAGLRRLTGRPAR